MSNDLKEQFVLLMTKCSKLNTAFPSLYELSVNEMELLGIISEGNSGNCEEGINLDMQAIQDRLKISKPAISYNLNMLEGKEYIVRKIDLKDRRRISVHITQKGLTAWEHFRQKHEDMWNQLVGEFGEGNMDQLTRLLTRLLEVIDSMLENESFQQ